MIICLRKHDQVSRLDQDSVHSALFTMITILVSITIPILIQEECKIECGADCALLCEIFFSCAAPGGEVGHLYEEEEDDDDRHHHHHHEHHEQGDLVADFETQRLRELTQSLTAVIRSLLS